MAMKYIVLTCSFPLEQVWELDIHDFCMLDSYNAVFLGRQFLLQLESPCHQLIDIQPQRICHNIDHL